MKTFYPACSTCGVPTDGQRFCDVACEFEYIKAQHKTALNTRTSLIGGILADLAKIQKLNEATLANYLKSCDEQAQIIRKHSASLTSQDA